MLLAWPCDAALETWEPFGALGDPLISGWALVSVVYAQWFSDMYHAASIAFGVLNERLTSCAVLAKLASFGSAAPYLAQYRSREGFTLSTRHSQRLIAAT